MTKIRLDVLLTERGLLESRNKAQALIMAGKVRVNGQVVIKAGTPTAPDADIELESGLPYVSRGGVKLAAALDAFLIDPAGLVCADVGASTGGFTDVLLQRKAARVYAIDVGYGQLAWPLRQDERVVVMERTNARYLETLPEPVGLVTVDASFISLELLLPAVIKWLAVPATVCVLVKPQFEATRSHVGKGGVVRDRGVHRDVLRRVAACAKQLGFRAHGVTASPITGPAGNREFFLHLGWQTNQPVPNLDEAIEVCLEGVD